MAVNVVVKPSKDWDKEKVNFSFILFKSFFKSNLIKL